MPDRRRHRGPHPKDAELFGQAAVGVLLGAVADLSWLLGRGYAVGAAVTLVGDRYQLRERQRQAVARCACSDAARDDRRARRVAVEALAETLVVVDGFNCVVTLEAAMSGGVVLVGRDGAHRDLSSVHGSYRRVQETAAALDAIAGLLRGAGQVIWYFDRPVSNSGRLAEMARAADPAWDVRVVNDPDRALIAAAGAVAATADSGVLDRCGAWVDLPGAALPAGAWLVDLSPDRVS